MNDDNGGQVIASVSVIASVIVIGMISFVSSSLGYYTGFDDGMVKGKNETIVFCMEQQKRCKISYDYLKLKNN